jgi:RNA polymerase sigma-70 factor (ECF subfamily)
MESIGIGQGLCHEKLGGLAALDIQLNQSSGNADDLKLQDFINRIVHQDQEAFSSLFKIMSSQVYSMAVRITGNVQLAEEVVEDTFFQVWRQAPRFDPARGKAKAWLLTIARSRALDARRSIPPFDELTGLETEASEGNPQQSGLPDLLSVIEENQMLHAALENLDSLPRQLLALAYFKGLSHEEIAAHTELPLGTVKSHLRRSIIHLREILSINH